MTRFAIVCCALCAAILFDMKASGLCPHVPHMRQTETSATPMVFAKALATGSLAESTT